MGNNKPIDKRVVQKVFETSAAGESRNTVGAFFHRSRRWAQHVLRNYSSKSFPTNFCEESWTGAQDYKGGRSAYSPVLGEENAFG